MEGGDHNTKVKASYKLYLRNTRSPYQVLSWRINYSSDMRSPSNWISILSSTTNFNNKTELRYIFEEVGHNLADAEYGLAIGGPFSNFELNEFAYTKFKATLKENKSNFDCYNFIRQYKMEDDPGYMAIYSDALVLSFLSPHFEMMVDYFVKYPNAVILIGGDSSTFDLALKCLQNGRPVFPIVESGGAARQFYDLLLMSYKYDEHNAIETPFANIIVNLQDIYQHPLDVTALDQPYKRAIAEIISHLKMTDDPDNPKIYAQE